MNNVNEEVELSNENLDDIPEITDDMNAEIASKTIEDNTHVNGIIVEPTEENNEEERSFEDMLADLGEAEVEEEPDFTLEDIKRSFNQSDLGISMTVEGYEKQPEEDDGIDPKYKISDESALKLLEIMNRVKAKEDFNIYANLPEEIKTMINDKLKRNGLGGYSVQSNTYRNQMAKSLINEFINTISMDRTLNNFNKEIENIATTANKEISELYKDYNNERDTYLANLLSKIPEDDPKRQVLIESMDAIYDSYALVRLKDAVVDMKPFKSIEIEKPQSRIYNRFEDKYQGSQYNMYSLKMVQGVLEKYNHTEVKNGNQLFLMGFAKFCQKYNPDVPQQHAFMYYTVYNIILLDIYKDKTLEEFGTPLLQRINEIIDILVSHQN